MKKTVFALTLILALGLTLSAQAQKIAVVNPMAVLEKSNPGKAIMNELQNFGQEREKRGAAMQNEINNLKKEINSPALNNDAREKKIATLTNLETNFKRFIEDYQRELAEKRNRALAKLQSEVVPIIEEIRKQKGISLVFDLGSAGVTAFDPAIDISDDVITAYNAKQAK